MREWQDAYWTGGSRIGVLVSLQISRLLYCLFPCCLVSLKVLLSPHSLTLSLSPSLSFCLLFLPRFLLLFLSLSNSFFSSSSFAFFLSWQASKRASAQAHKLTSHFSRKIRGGRPELKLMLPSAFCGGYSKTFVPFQVDPYTSFTHTHCISSNYQGASAFDAVYLTKRILITLKLHITPLFTICYFPSIQHSMELFSFSGNLRLSLLTKK